MTAWANPMHWPLSLSVLAVLLLSAAISWGAVRLVRRLWPPHVNTGNNELVGFTYAVYGLIYGVFLAFIIVVGWQRYAETEQLVLHETTLLSELWRDSIVARPAVRDNIQHDLIAYAQSVIEDEWPEMAARGRGHPRTEEIYEHLWRVTYGFEPQTKLQEAYMDQFLSRMNELSGARRLRILHSRMGIHDVLWVVLLVGAVPAVGYTLLFSSRHAWVQVAIMGSIMSIIMLGLLVTLSLQHPFRGAVSIQPDAFHRLLDSFDQRRMESSGRSP